MAMADEDPADDTDELPPLPTLPSGRFLRDDDGPFPDDGDESPPASPPKQKERGRLRIQNVGGSLTFLLQVGSHALSPLLPASPSPHVFIPDRGMGVSVSLAFDGVCCKIGFRNAIFEKCVH